MQKPRIRQLIIPLSLLLTNCGDFEPELGSDFEEETAEELRSGTLFAPMIFDFGTPTSKLYTSATRVTPSDHYAAALGYGWLDTPTVYAKKRFGVYDAIDRDFNYSRDASFRVDLPNGVYDVELRVGDTYAHGPSAVIVEGFAFEEHQENAAGDWVTLHHTVRVEDGNLDVRILDPSAGASDPGDAIINGLTITAHDLPPDPTSWVTHSSGTQYRRATEAERIDNDWPIHTFLVYSSTGVFSAADASVLLPVDDTELHALTLDLVGSDPALDIAEIGYGVASSGGSQSLVRYEIPSAGATSTGAKGTLLEDTVRGGFSASIEPSLGSPAYKVSSGEDSWQLSPITLPGGTLPVGTDLYRTHFAGAGSPSFLAPNAPDAYDFALIGEITWCMARENGWAADLGMRALTVHDGFAACPEGQCVHHHDVEMFTRALYCNVTTSEAAAAACDSGNCAPNQFGHDYSYKGCNRNAACYANNIVDNLQQAKDEGHNVPSLHLAQVVHARLVQVPNPPEGTFGVCGAAAFPTLGGCNVTAPFTMDGTGVASDSSSCPDPATSTHEFGHNFGALHDAKNEFFAGNGCTGTVMTSGSGKCNNFSVDNALTLESCDLDDQTKLSYANIAWCPDLTQIETEDCPRSGGQLLFP